MVRLFLLLTILFFSNIITINLFAVDDVEIPKIKISSEANEEKDNTAPAIDSNSAYDFYFQGSKIMDSNPKRAKELFLKAISIDSEHADSHKLLGYVAGLLFDYELADKHFAIAQKIYKERGQILSPEYAELIMLIGGNYYTQNKYNDSLVLYFQSYGIYKAINYEKTENFAGLTYAIGANLVGLNRLEEGEKYYQESKEIHESLNLTGITNFGHLMYGYGYLQYKLAKYPESLESYKKARDIYDNLNMNQTTIYGNLLYNTASVYEALSDTDSAISYYEQAYKAYQAAEYNGSEVEAVKQRAEDLRLQKNSKEVEKVSEIDWLNEVNYK